MINIFQPNLSVEELASIEEVFRSNWIGKGKQVLDFEKAFAQTLGVDPGHLTSTTCCTEGLFLAPRLFSLGTGDEIIIPTISFVAVGSAVVASGARPVFCDVDPHSLNVRCSDIASKISSRTKAVYITHYAGVPCDMDPIVEMCRSRGIILIEDSACSIHSFYKGRACGTFGDMGVWSFDPMKIICTGDGGMIYLQSEALLNAAKEMLYLGLPARQKSGMDSSASGQSNWWEYEVSYPGRRAIMNNIAGAIGLAQLLKLPQFLARRRFIDEQYRRELSDIDWLQLPPNIPSDCQSSYYLFWIQAEQRDSLAQYLLENGVYSTYRYWPLHKVQYFSQASDVASSFPGAEEASCKTLNIPLHQSLTDADVSKIIELINKFKP